MTPFFDRRVAGWVAQRIPGCERGFGKCHALGVEHQEQIVAGAVFHNWSPENRTIEVSVAAEDPRWFCRSVLNVGFGYVFDDLQCQMAIARQRLDNDRARAPWLALGGSEVPIPRLYGRERDGSIITLTDDQWRASKFYRGPENGR